MRTDRLALVSGSVSLAALILATSGCQPSQAERAEQARRNQLALSSTRPWAPIVVPLPPGCPQPIKETTAPMSGAAGDRASLAVGPIFNTWPVIDIALVSPPRRAPFRAGRPVVAHATGAGKPPRGSTGVLLASGTRVAPSKRATAAAGWTAKSRGPAGPRVGWRAPTHKAGSKASGWKAARKVVASARGRGGRG